MQISADSLQRLNTSAPVQSLHDQFLKFLNIAPTFRIIHFTLNESLKEDECANKLRSRLLDFEWYMEAVTCKMLSAMRNAKEYYCDTITETETGLLKITFPKEIIPSTFRESIQTIWMEECAQGTIAALEEAIPILTDHALPLLPEIERELKAYIDAYKERYYMTQKRAQSWVPSALQDLMWGSIEPATEDPSQIEILPERLYSTVTQLERLPKFLEELRDHFKRLAILTRTEYESLGYFSTEAIARLYAERSRCLSLFMEMVMLGAELHKPFTRVRGFKIDKGIDPILSRKNV